MTTPLDAAAQAAALLGADAAALTPTPPENGGNLAPVREAILDKFAVFGRQGARGQASLTHVALMFAASVREKILTDEDAAAVYNTYAKAFNDMVDGKLAATGIARLDVSKVSISMLRTFGKSAPVAHADLYQRVSVLLNSVAKEERVGSTYITFVTVNRKLQAAFEASKLIDASKFAVSDDQILEWISKTPRADKTDEARLADAIAAIGKLVKSGKYAGLEAHYDGLVKFHGDFKSGKPATTILRSLELAGIEGSTVVH